MTNIRRAGLAHGPTTPGVAGLTGWALVLAATSLHAQQLAPVTITATRTEALPIDVPASVTTIDGDRLRAAGRPEINLSESLSLVPGLNARERQNYAQDLQLSIRGFGARSTFGVRGVRLYVDGIPATMPDGQGQLSHIDLASAGRIEVLRGPFSVLYGNSSGGVMQVFTEPGDGPPKVTATLAAGSDGLLRPGVRVSGSTPALRYVVSANHLELDGWRDHSAVTRDIGNARLDWRTGEGRDWTFIANSVNLKAQDPLGLSRAQFESAPRSVDPSALTFDTRKTVRQDQLGLVHEVRVDADDRLRLMLYAGQRETEQFQSIPVATQASPLHPGGVIGLARDYAGTDLRWTRRFSPGNEIVAGLAYDRMVEHRQGWQNFIGATLGVQGALRRDERNVVWNVDPYVQGQWKPADHWRLTAGVRHSAVHFDSRDGYIVGPNGNDSGSVSYSATLPAAAVMYEFSPRLHAYVSAGKGFETPTFNELAYRASGGTGLNFSLRPSRSRNLEVGLKGRSGGDDFRQEWSAAVFDTRTTDEIVTQTNSGGRSTFTNAGATRRRGVELAWSGRLREDWQLNLAQTWLTARYADGFLTCVATPCATPNVLVASGNRIPGVPQATTAAEVAWQPEKGWRAGLEWRRSSRVWVNDLNTGYAPSFELVALNAGYVWDLRGWSLAANLRVDNLMDRRYAGSVIVNEGNSRFYEPGAGRNYTLKVSGTYAF